MQIPCPGCGEQLPLSPELLGKKIRCGGCQRVVEIPMEFAEHDNAVAAASTVAAVESIAVPDSTQAATQSTENIPTMLVDCTCGNRSRVPTSSSQSEVRCPSCRRMMRIPDPPAQRDDSFLSGGAFPATQSVPTKSSATPSSLDQPLTVHPYRVQPKQQPTSNTPIIITAASCLLGLALVIGTAVLIDGFSDDPANTTETDADVEPVGEQDSLVATKRAVFQEGYSMLLPAGFEPLSREVTDKGYIVYRFRRGNGLRLTVAIISSKRYERNSSLPKEISEASVTGVRELQFDANPDVTPTPHIIDRMRAVLFRYYETRTYANRPFFKYTMVVMDEGRKLVVHFDGLYGDGENITPPEHWRDSLLTLRRESDLQAADVELAFAPTPTESKPIDGPPTAAIDGNLTLLDAGYAINVPKDFEPIERNAYRGGETRYKLRSPTGTLKIRIKPSQRSNRRSIPPVVLEDPPANVNSAIGELGGRYYFNAKDVESMILDGMTSCLCRVDHAPSSPTGTKVRGYFLIAMDEQKEVYLELTGEMKGPAPEAWRACVLSLRHANEKESQMPTTFPK